MEPQAWSDLVAGLRRGLQTVGLDDDPDALRLAERWLEKYVCRTGRSDAALLTLRWNGPPSYTGFDLSQLALLAGVVLRRPQALALWERFRKQTADDLLAELGTPTEEEARVLRYHIDRELAEVVDDAARQGASIHCLEWAYQNCFRRERLQPPRPLPRDWHFGLTTPLCLVPGRPFLPSDAELAAFIETECKCLPALRGILTGLRTTPVGLVLGSHRLTALELIYLRYRGSPAALPQRTPSAGELVELLNEAGCTAVRGGPVTRENVEKILSRDVRCQAQGQVEAARAAGQLPARPGEQWEALTRPDGYVWGDLFRRQATQGGGK